MFFYNGKATERQLEVLKFLLKFHRMFGYMPSTRDIQDNFKFASQTASVNHLKALEKKGYIRRNSKKARCITILLNDNEIYGQAV